ncbi:MAG: RnfABCDGE type electron transport complex subunit D [Erysipelotrichales bacterium]|nr:RnfABCDGE type electron transport complex subunit D [Erysipelotrichales bacterium]MBQ1385332.1 RnfABCDGE type electron transport complex subunit D [Erysipelotrichales bacterium]
MSLDTKPKAKKPAPVEEPFKWDPANLEMTAVLGVLFVISMVLQFMNHGIKNVLHCVLLLLCSAATALLAEGLWGKLVCKKNPFRYALEQYGWITSLILVLLVPAKTGVYPIVIGTLFAVLFVKQFFGGYKFSVFHPASAGAAILFMYLGNTSAKDVVTSASPVAEIAKTYGWLIVKPDLRDKLLTPFNGLFGLFLGKYDAGIGTVSAAAILLAGIYLVIRKRIDWKTPVTYLCGVFVLTGLIGILRGTGIWYPLFHLLAGSTMFTAVFLLTDPVTGSKTTYGKILVALGAALLTVLIRVKGDLAEGTVFAVLFMNMLTPWIDSVTEKKENPKNKIAANRPLLITAITLVASLMICGFMAPSLQAIEPAEPVEIPFLNPDKPQVLGADYSDFEPVILDKAEDGTKTVYTVEAWGYALEHSQNPAKTKNIFKVTVEDKKVVSVEYVEFHDSEYIGDDTMKPEFLDQFNGMDLTNEESSVDSVTGATFTSRSVMAAVNAVMQDLKEAGE